MATCRAAYVSDEDVIQERERVCSMGSTQQEQGNAAVVIKRLVKIFSAVRRELERSRFADLGQGILCFCR